MKRTIGIDVSQDFLDVVSYDGHSSTLKHYSQHSATIFKKIIEDFAIDKETLIALEATGVYHLKLAHYLHQNGYLISVVNPLKTKKFGEMKFNRAKTDKTDAKLIAQYAYEQHPPLYQPRSSEQEDMLVMIKGIEDLLQMRLQLTNRLHALDKRVQSHSVMRTALESTLKTLNQQIAQLEKASVKLAQSFAPQTYQLLRDIPGVGQGMARALISYYGNFENFENANQVVAFSGLNPNPRESGTSIHHKGSISKKGHASLRRTAYMCALTAKKSNLMCQALFDRLVAKGKPKKLALVAVANKLLRQCFAVVKYSQPFDAQFQQRILKAE